MSVPFQTINRNSLFSRAYRSKLSFVSPYVITYVVPRKKGRVRVGVTASKKIGCAVVRNRARRVVKAAASQVLQNADGCFDVVFVCRSATAAQKSTALEPILAKHLRKAGVLR